MNQHVCGVVLLRSDGAALMQLRDDIPGISDPGLWVFPGGHCESEESPEEGAFREFFEETRYSCARLQHLITFKANELGYPGDYPLSFYWESFDGIQAYECCEGQELRFVGRKELRVLPRPAYLDRVWDLALSARAAADWHDVKL